MGNTNGHDTPDSPTHDQMRRRSTSSKIHTTSLVTLFEKLELTADDGNSHPGELSRSTFENVFHGPLNIFGKLMFVRMINGHNNRESITREQFVKAGKDIVKMFDEKQQQKYYFKLFAGGKDHLTKEDALKMVNISYALTLSASKIQYTKHKSDDNVFESMVNGMFGNEEILNFESFESWLKRHCPHMFCGVHNWVYTILTGSKMPSEMETASFPQIDRFGSGSYHMTLGMLWALSATLPQLYTQESPSAPEPSTPSANNPLLNTYNLLMKLARLAQCQSWSNLYNSTDHGLSGNRFTHHCTSYSGSSVTLLSFEGRNMYCLAMDCGWKESSQKFGGSSCMLIQMSPVFRVMQSGDNMVLWNETSRQLPKGIQIGRSGKSVILRIPEGFDEIEHYGVKCALHNVEVWGCGGSVALNAQLKQRQWERKDVEKNKGRKLKLENWNENPDRQLLDWGGVKSSASYEGMR